jgi:hypothetical protein
LAIFDTQLHAGHARVKHEDDDFVLVGRAYVKFVELDTARRNVGHNLRRELAIFDLCGGWPS